MTAVASPAILTCLACTAPSFQLPCFQHQSSLRTIPRLNTRTFDDPNLPKRSGLRSRNVNVNHFDNVPPTHREQITPRAMPVHLLPFILPIHHLAFALRFPASKPANYSRLVPRFSAAAACANILWREVATSSTGQATGITNPISSTEA
ncbi:hypothetical protein B0T16DRAFT_133765 [Cercophora newfieldiana]|uniref:Uncharacterized protein n=1 Tax=Cercophora newfieldiana TaxID=92897 RepID=A0AA39YCV6_9PEZI|nr:hypothetical protein B0T16DRAFT_133765 [Cercophora newfieldiana]